MNHKYNINSQSQRTGGLLPPLVELTNSAPSLTSAPQPLTDSVPLGEGQWHTRTFNTRSVHTLQRYHSFANFNNMSCTVVCYHWRHYLTNTKVPQCRNRTAHYLTNTSVQCNRNRTGCVVVVSWSSLGDPADWSQIPARNIRRIIIDRAGFNTDKKSPMITAQMLEM